MSKRREDRLGIVLTLFLLIIISSVLVYISAKFAPKIAEWVKTWTFPFGNGQLVITGVFRILSADGKVIAQGPIESISQVEYEGKPAATYQATFTVLMNAGNIDPNTVQISVKFFMLSTKGLERNLHIESKQISLKWNEDGTYSGSISFTYEYIVKDAVEDILTVDGIALDQDYLLGLTHLYQFTVTAMTTDGKQLKAEKQLKHEVAYNVIAYKPFLDLEVLYDFKITQEPTLETETTTTTSSSGGGGGGSTGTFDYKAISYIKPLSEVQMQQKLKTAGILTLVIIALIIAVTLVMRSYSRR
ncbi:MAG: hypothetical protein NDF55_08780 [archaeon GB-1867-005]|nr:hypothetical protein [Candidatus Culexmicrobium cathedralense]